MLGVLFRRLVVIVPLVFGVTIIVFSLTFLLPGNPAVILAGDQPTQAQVNKITLELGLNKPIIVQYGDWLRHAAHGEFGNSLYSGQAVSSEISSRLPVTLSLAIAALVLALAIGVPLGIAAGLRHETWIDRVCTVVATAGVAIPDFWLGLLLIILFAVKLHLLPSVGYVPITSSVTGWSSHILLPALALSFQTAAYIARQLRIALADVVQRQYIVTARAKGLRPPKVYGKHALKNAFIPTITVIGLQMAGLLGGATIIEQVFGIPGLGSLLVQSVGDKDIPTIQGLAVVFALGVLSCNLLVDLSYSYFNPKVRVS